MSDLIHLETDAGVRCFKADGSHYNGGAAWFGYGYRAVGEPRFRIVRKWFRRGLLRGTTADLLYVDGAEVADIAEAEEALTKKPVFTAEEIAALRLISDQSADHRRIINFEIRYALTNKGAIVWDPPGRCCRTDVGREAINSAEKATA